MKAIFYVLSISYFFERDANFCMPLLCGSAVSFSFLLLFGAVSLGFPLRSQYVASIGGCLAVGAHRMRLPAARGTGPHLPTTEKRIPSPKG